MEVYLSSGVYRDSFQPYIVSHCMAAFGRPAILQTYFWDSIWSTSRNVWRLRASKFLKVNIFYEDLGYEVIQEKEEWNYQKLISDIGGGSMDWSIFI